MQNFSLKQLRFMDFVEQEWFKHGQLPSKEKTVGAVAGLSSEDFNQYLNNPRIVEHMRDVRGVDLKGDRAGGALTPEQLVVCNTMLNLSDTRSSRKKLQDLGISPSKWDAWKRDPAVQEYLRYRAENILGDNMHEAHMGLVDAVGRGDVKAIQLYYEITGRWSSKTVGELNVEFLLVKIIEIISKHVSDPQILAGIGDDLLALAPSSNKPAIPRAAAVTQPMVIDAEVTTPPVAPVAKPAGQFLEL